MSLDGETETLRFIEGESGADGWKHQHDEQGLRSAARLLRRIHDASADWVPPDDAVFAAPASRRRRRLRQCATPGPWNFVWRDGEAVALIDWDFLHRASRLSDVAYALHVVRSEAAYETDRSRPCKAKVLIGAADRRAASTIGSDGASACPLATWERRPSSDTAGIPTASSRSTSHASSRAQLAQLRSSLDGARPVRPDTAPQPTISSTRSATATSSRRCGSVASGPSSRSSLPTR